MRRRGLAIGIDIGGTKVAAGLVDSSGRVLAEVRRSTPGQDPREVEQVIVELVHELSRDKHVWSVGIGAAGWMDLAGSTVLFSPHLAWRNEPLQQNLERLLKRRVYLANDADGAAWAEWRFGAGVGESRLVCITLGTGIGGAMIMDGRLERGRFGVAGEFGHQIIMPQGQRCECGNRGCWEQYASGNALGREARELAAANSPVAQELLRSVEGRIPDITGAVVTHLALEGDRTAIELVGEVGEWLGLGLANLAAALDPGMFVIGGGLSSAGELLLEPARRAYSRNLTGRGFRPEARIEQAALGPAAGMIGAADLSRVAARH
ncbi:ROK family glucokinase [Arthrobacter sp. zg-Y916]|uniref:Glucokinase n=2 Tax=Arthrobacter TaxID=1663 RepID=A0A9X1MH88_9MICC|nr:MULTISPECIES: ROK family glucokinase [Arthrobacter]MCC3283683.1 ROK family glucokinase [Arthrobacter caoxuetaonis]MCC3299175.1 ROK family glucokinase [Arthrobacter caoxuetaonis]MCC9193121.1 ROK family glucokinase [Arthrobacter sp. zg-Y916]USQ58834.1 ROK family glucokinase [Arthrobacter caoxuetaonis]